jgi:hypothetical protein
MAETPQDQADKAALETSNYEVIRRRLVAQSETLAQKVNELNQKRQTIFGATAMEVVSGESLRTEHNCIPQDIINLGDHLLFGYNVHVRSKLKTAPEDVFSLHKFERDGTSFTLRHLPDDQPDNFLNQPRFLKDFEELYTYYKDAKLRQLRRVDGHLLGIFQIGATLANTRTLAWQVDSRDRVTYRDNNGNDNNKLRPPYDFNWRVAGRDRHVLGRHPHVSIEDKVFVETVGGDLTIKIEDNTEDGLGIYSELVNEPRQKLSDAEIAYAEIGALILLRVKPYREPESRFFVFNTITKQVDRIDAIGSCCLQLPESHGVIFPGGYALETGEVKRFEFDVRDMRIESVVRSPNGEDVLYVFYRPGDGAYLLLAYNLIRKEVQTPLLCKGYSVFADGTLLIFRAQPEDIEPARVHPLQIWRTPFMDDVHAASKPVDNSLLGRIGNADLVRGISDALSIRKTILHAAPTVELYGSIITAAERMIDGYFWLQNEEVDLQEVLKQIAQTAKLVLDEFQKVRELRERASKALQKAQHDQRDLLASIRVPNWNEIGRFVDALNMLRTQRGRLISLRDLKYIDLAEVDKLEAAVIEQNELINAATATFLLGEDALSSYRTAIAAVVTKVDGLDSSNEAQAIKAEVDRVGEGLTLLTEIVGSLKIDDARARTQILEQIAQVLGQQNRSRALLEGKLRSLLAQEGQAEFAIQFQLLAQSVTGALAMAESPEQTEDLLSRIMVQLEEMEGRFSQHESFLDKLATKRDEVFEAFEARRQQLLDERQRRASATLDAAERMIAGIERRAQKMTSVDEFNAYFAADAMVLKVRELAGRLRELQDPVKADDLESRLKSTRDQTIRALRDKLEMFEEGGDNVIRLGNHRFSVQRQNIELTMLPRGGVMCFHITGSDLFEPVRDSEFQQTRDLWDQTLVSEAAHIYRAEFLAASLLREAEEAGERAVQDLIRDALDEETLLPRIRRAIEQRYDEGYERGVHDADAAALLKALLGLYHVAGLMRYAPQARALAALFWGSLPESARDKEQVMQRALWVRRARSLGHLRATFQRPPDASALIADLHHAIHAFCTSHRLDALEHTQREAAQYLYEELQRPEPKFVLNRDAKQLANDLIEHLTLNALRDSFVHDLTLLLTEHQPDAALQIATSWLEAFLATRTNPAPSAALLIPEAAAYLLTHDNLSFEPTATRVATTVEGLLGQHARIQDQRMELRLDEFISRLYDYFEAHLPRYQTYRKRQHELLEERKRQLRLNELTPHVLSTFVRNRLIDEVYLPLIGSNLAKQMGSLGESGRSDRSGLLLLISPPGYGKTTLMEYVANRLGLAFVKVNGPAIGHNVTSIDPTEAPNATARQEVEKINLALRMGNNVMLYLDDIQHTSPELLQKFISLCDATRRMEGVWAGQTQTYDLRGKRFCVVMAGNPYTETGERFQIPDMLANRADTYNLGDILDGAQDAFAMSYIENALTANPTLAPLANRDRKDVMLFMRMARGEEIPLSELSHGYSGVEASEIVSVLKKLNKCQEVLLKVNLEYIRSASQEDAFRTEPPFKLQGSYRNMTKLAEKVVSAMNDAELEALIDDHYLGESQTLTTTAEQNLLKVAELRGRMTPAQQERWKNIKAEYQRRNLMGGRDDDPVARVAGPLAGLVQHMERLNTSVGAANSSALIAQELHALRAAIIELPASMPAPQVIPAPAPAATPTPAPRPLIPPAISGSSKTKPKPASTYVDPEDIKKAFEDKKDG